MYSSLKLSQWNCPAVMLVELPAAGRGILHLQKKYWLIYQTTWARIRLTASGMDVSEHCSGSEPAKVRVTTEPGNAGIYTRVPLTHTHTHIHPSINTPLFVEFV